MARGHRLNTSIVLVAVHGLSGLFRAVSAVEPSLCRPLSPSLISHLASVDVKQHGHGQTRKMTITTTISNSNGKKLNSELRSCVKVEVAVLGSPSLIIRTVSVDVKQH